MECTVRAGTQGWPVAETHDRAAFLVDKFKAAAKEQDVDLSSLHERVQVEAFMDGPVARLHVCNINLSGHHEGAYGEYGTPSGGYFNRNQIGMAPALAQRLSINCYREDEYELQMVAVVNRVKNAGWDVTYSKGGSTFGIETPGSVPDGCYGRKLPPKHLRVQATVLTTRRMHGDYCTVPAYLTSDQLVHAHMTVDGFLAVLEAVQAAMVPDED